VSPGRNRCCWQALADGEPDRIDPDKWRPLIFSFQHFYGLTPEKVHGSELAKIPEAAYRA
jgi:hypothetical protein